MKTRFWTLALVACLLSVAVGVHGDDLVPSADTKVNAGDPRTWTDQKGRKVDGEFVASKDGKVKIKRKSDGKVFELPLELLSATDQRFVTEQAGAGAAKNAPQVPVDQVRATEITNSIGMKLVLIPAGEFMMGSPDADPNAGSDEKPAHRVQITKPFYMGVYEVTQGEYERVMGKNPSHFSANGGGKEKVVGQDTTRYPVENVSWEDAVAFSKKLSDLPAEKAAGRSYRLPTEAEWEYAARAGTRTVFPWGDSLSSQQANFDGNKPYGDTVRGPYLKRTTTVGSYDANPLGVYDTVGNVWEWCADRYAADYYAKGPASDPAGPSEPTHVVRRGGLVGAAEASGMSAFDLARSALSSSGGDVNTSRRLIESQGGATYTVDASYRVRRGGDWGSSGRDCRSAARSRGEPQGRYEYSGFRVAGGRSDP